MPTNEPTKATPKAKRFFRSSEYTYGLVVIDLDDSHGDSPSPQWAQLHLTHCGDVPPVPHPGRPLGTRTVSRARGTAILDPGTVTRSPLCWEECSGSS